MARGIKNQPVEMEPAQPAVQPAVQPLIMLQPRADGTRMDIYGLTGPAAVEELRLALLHLVALQTGVPIMRETITREMAVAPVKPHVNGVDPRKGPAPKKAPAQVKPRAGQTRLSAADDDEELDALDLAELMGSS